MAKLNQIIAIEKGVKSRVYQFLTDMDKAAQKPALFEGFSKSFSPLEEDGEQLPPESKKVQFEAKSLIASVQAAMTEAIDLVARKDWTNCAAKGDIVADGVTVLENVPVTFLLTLEKQLSDLHAFVSHLPTLDIAEDWTLDPNSGLYRTEETKTHRTKKVQKPIVLYDATAEHPAQTQLITEDVISGYWRQSKYSGALPRPQKDLFLTRIETLRNAVKAAREQANAVEELTPPKIGAALFGFVFGT